MHETLTLFAVIVLSSGLPDSQPLAMTVACTILLSIFFHGITANPWARAYDRRRQRALASRSETNV